ncbi:MAG: ferritin-like domain-containing protein [Acidobacteriota bacterium]|nr:ferritin-like domain-containing protein [Acidobacteriota bacterium]
MSYDKKEAIGELIANPVNRRDFAKRTMAAGLWAAAGASVIGSGATVQAQGITDVDILNFALNLEYLEAEFYTVATTGRRIQDLDIGVTGTGTLGGTVGGSVVSMDNRVMQVARDIANEEQMHVKLLRTALGSAAVAKPAINLAALGIGFANATEFLTLARAFEDVGVTAYLGAAPLISSRAILAAAAGIALTEGQHAGVLRYLVYDRGIAQPQLDSADVPPLGSPNGRLFNVTNEGLSPARTPSQVLAVVYANKTAGATSGGFFPGGFNGTIRTV